MKPSILKRAPFLVENETIFLGFSFFPAIVINIFLDHVASFTQVKFSSFVAFLKKLVNQYWSVIVFYQMGYLWSNEA